MKAEVKYPKLRNFWAQVHTDLGSVYSKLNSRSKAVRDAMKTDEKPASKNLLRQRE